VVGEAWAVLLDRSLPGWRDSLEADDTRPLDALLATALASRHVRPLEFTPAERRAAEESARANASEVRSRRTRARQEFLTRRFHARHRGGSEACCRVDPEHPGLGRRRCTRWVAQNTAGSIEVLAAALTAPPGRIRSSKACAG
jgi:hypothetical protein